MSDMLRRFLIATTVLTASATASAQDPLSLREAIGLALARNPAARATRASADEAAGRVRQARSAFLPRVDLVESWQRGNHPVFAFGSLLAQQRFSEANFAIAALNRPDALSNHRVAVVIDQTLYDGSRTNSAMTAARLGSEIAGQESRRIALDLYGEAVAAYGRAIAASASLAAARAAVESAAEDLRRAEERRNAGFETEAAVLALRVAVAEADVRRIQAAAEVGNARAALNAVIGAPLDDQRPLADLGEPPAVAVDSSRLETLAVKYRPDLLLAALRERLAETQIRIARASFLPQVSAQAGVEANGRSFAKRAGTWTAGVELRWNLFAGGADAARLASARAAAVRAGAEREQVAQRVGLELRRARSEHDSAIARRSAGRAIVAQAVESRRIIRERYDAGLASAADLTRASELVLRAEAIHIAALVDVHVSAAGVERAAGRIEEVK